MPLTVHTAPSSTAGDGVQIGAARVYGFEAQKYMDLKRRTASTVFYAQLEKKDWHSTLGSGVHAYASEDGSVHKTVLVDMG